MIDIEIINVLSGNHIDLVVPRFVEVVEFDKLIFLLFGKIREIAEQ